jgi:hypothetical protein
LSLPHTDALRSLLDLVITVAYSAALRTLNGTEVSAIDLLALKTSSLKSRSAPVIRLFVLNVVGNLTQETPALL